MLFMYDSLDQRCGTVFGIWIEFLAIQGGWRHQHETSLMPRAQIDYTSGIVLLGIGIFTTLSRNGECTTEMVRMLVWVGML